MDDILKHREDIKNNILKSFQVDLQKSEENDIEKARSGVYGDTAENRKLSRVGQKYGSKKQDDEVSSQSSSKQNEDNHSKNSKSIEEHAKNTSEETLKKVSENEKAPEDLRNAAKKELENRKVKDKKDWGFDNNEELMGDDGYYLESTLKKNPIKAISGFVKVSALRAKYMEEDGENNSDFLKNRSRVINKLFNKLDDSEKIKVLKKLDKNEKELIDF